MTGLNMSTPSTSEDTTILGEGKSDGWQPIDTAPRDGTHFLAVLRREATEDMEGHWWKEFTEVREIWFKPYRMFGMDMPWHAGDPFDSSDNMPSDHMGEDVPSHWMPLPTPPINPPVPEGEK